MAESSLIHLWLEIELSDDGFAEDAEIELRDQLVAAIESQGIGEVGGFGSGVGSMDVSVLVHNEAVGREQLTALVQELAPGASFAIDTLPAEDSDV